MTELLERAFAALRHLPPERQDAIARALLVEAANEEPADIEPEHLEAVLEGLEQARRGEFSSLTPYEALGAAFSRHRR